MISIQRAFLPIIIKTVFHTNPQTKALEVLQTAAGSNSSRNQPSVSERYDVVVSLNLSWNEAFCKL